MFARFIFWRLIGLAALVFSVSVSTWMLSGGLSSSLSGITKNATSANPAGAAAAATRLQAAKPHLPEIHLPKTPSPSNLLEDAWSGMKTLWSGLSILGVPLLQLLIYGTLITLLALCCARMYARGSRHYVRLRVSPYRTDRASIEGLVSMFEALHKRLLRRWWKRLLQGQPSIAMEVHLMPRMPSRGEVQTPRLRASSPGDRGYQAWLVISCPAGLEQMVQASVRTAYPNSRVDPVSMSLGSPPSLLRLKKHAEFIKRVKVLDRYEHEREPPMNRLLTVMGACGEPSYVQITLTPDADDVRALCQARIQASRAPRHPPRPRATQTSRALSVRGVRAQGALEVQHRPLFFVDLRVVAPSRAIGERIASRAARGGRGEPAGGTLGGNPPEPARPLHPSRGSRRGQSTAQPAPRGVRLD